MTFAHPESSQCWVKRDSVELRGLLLKIQPSLLQNILATTIGNRSNWRNSHSLGIFLVFARTFTSSDPPESIKMIFQLFRLCLVGILLTTLCPWASAQGRVFFSNSKSTAVLWCDGTPVPHGLATAGLYYTPNLAGTWEDFQLVATTPVAPGTDPNWNGIFIGGTIELPGAYPGETVLLQVRAWTGDIDSYEEAINSAEFVTNSKVMALALGGGILPTPNLVTQGGLESFYFQPLSYCPPIPEPSTLLLTLTAMAGLALGIRRRA